MAELYAVCEACGNKIILGDSERIRIEDADGQVLEDDDLHEELTQGLQRWLEAQACPGCGGPLRVPAEA